MRTSFTRRTFLAQAAACALESPAEVGLTTGGVRISFPVQADGTYRAQASFAGGTFALEPAVALRDRADLPVTYATVVRDGVRVVARATVKAADGLVFTLVDVYSVPAPGLVDVARTVDVKNASAGEPPGFFTQFGITAGAARFASVEPFIPSVMYKNMFDARANPARIALRPADRDFCFREDRLPLPVAAFREPGKGFAVSVALHDTGCETVCADADGQKVDAGYRFGGVGFVRDTETDAFALVATYPGCDRRRGGLGARYLPAVDGQKAAYKLRLRFDAAPDYGTAVEKTWRGTVALYRPRVRFTDAAAARQGLLKTLYSYRQSPDGDQDLVTSKAHKPGFPWSVYLKDDFKVNDSTYELGFVGAQPVAAYALLQAGVLEKNAGWRKHGEAVIDFWAREGLSELGFPNSRYYPIHGVWDKADCSLRQACTGMGGIYDAWAFLRKHGESRPAWLAACTRFGEWLLKNQAPDGSWPMACKPYKVEDGAHPVNKPNKALTICAIPFLARLYSGTKDPRWRAAALRAADFCYAFNHRDYLYVACVVDNPQVFDSESGYEAMKGFLAAYALDRTDRWLKAARQAATYAETWVYLHEIPPEKDARPPTDWPFDGSVVGLHILTIDQPAADLGFAWTAYWYDRLARLAHDDHFRLMAQIALHNVKQSMNLGGKLYPGYGEGLQLEASTLRTGWKCRRRTHSIREALTWNFAAHLQPYAQFLDKTGVLAPPELLKGPRRD